MRDLTLTKHGSYCHTETIITIYFSSLHFHKWQLRDSRVRSIINNSPSKGIDTVLSLPLVSGVLTFYESVEKNNFNCWITLTEGLIIFGSAKVSSCSVRASCTCFALPWRLFCVFWVVKKTEGRNRDKFACTELPTSAWLKKYTDRWWNIVLIIFLTRKAGDAIAFRLHFNLT